MQSPDENVLTSQCEIVPMDDSDDELEIDIARTYANINDNKASKRGKTKNKDSFIGAGLRINTQSSDSKRNQLSRNIYDANRIWFA